jgi:hypothetical protein
MQWLDRWLLTPPMRLAIRQKTNKAFRRLETLVGSADKKQ